MEQLRLTVPGIMSQSFGSIVALAALSLIPLAATDLLGSDSSGSSQNDKYVLRIESSGNRRRDGGPSPNRSPNRTPTRTPTSSARGSMLSGMTGSSASSYDEQRVAVSVDPRGRIVIKVPEYSPLSSGSSTAGGSMLDEPAESLGMITPKSQNNWEETQQQSRGHWSQSKRPKETQFRLIIRRR
jgi:hypothetical protein